MKCQRVPVEQAALELGMNPQAVREHMKRDLFPTPIGFVSNPSGKKFQYHIYRHMLDEHLHIGKEGIAHES